MSYNFFGHDDDDEQKINFLPFKHTKTNDIINLDK